MKDSTQTKDPWVSSSTRLTVPPEAALIAKTMADENHGRCGYPTHKWEIKTLHCATVLIPNRPYKIRRRYARSTYERETSQLCTPLRLMPFVRVDHLTVKLLLFCIYISVRATINKSVAGVGPSARNSPPILPSIVVQSTWSVPRVPWVSVLRRRLCLELTPELLGTTSPTDDFCSSPRSNNELPLIKSTPLLLPQPACTGSRKLSGIEPGHCLDERTKTCIPSCHGWLWGFARTVATKSHVLYTYVHASLPTTRAVIGVEKRGEAITTARTA